MAISQATLSTKLQAEIISLLGVADDPAQLQKVMDAIAKAVVDEIQGLAEVNVTSGSSAGTYGVQ